MISIEEMPPAMQPTQEDEKAVVYIAVRRFEDEYGMNLEVVRQLCSTPTTDEALALCKLHLLFQKLDHVVPEEMLAACISAYNEYQLFLEFRSLIDQVITGWEALYGIPECAAWSEPPFNCQSLRTYIWAQDSFRQLVRMVAGRYLNDYSPIGVLTSVPEDEATEVSQLELLLDWLEAEYAAELGRFALATYS